MYVCVSMYLHVYAYVEICNRYIKCSDKNLAELKFRSKSSPRDTCFHSPPVIISSIQSNVII